MKKEQINPKALNLEILKNSDSNATLGFKIEPEIKLQLAEEANNLGISLSSYVKKIVISNRDVEQRILPEIKRKIEHLKFENKDLLLEINNLNLGRKTLNKKIEGLGLKIEELTEKNRRMTAKLAFYENEKLKEIFLENRNKTISYKADSGEIIKKDILSIGDAYFVMINSFKNKR